MKLKEFAQAAEFNKFDVEFDNEWHELTRQEIINNDEIGLREIRSWFPSVWYGEYEIIVTCEWYLVDKETEA